MHATCWTLVIGPRVAAGSGVPWYLCRGVTHLHLHLHGILLGAMECHKIISQNIPLPDTIHTVGDITRSWIPGTTIPVVTKHDQ